MPPPTRLWEASGGCGAGPATYVRSPGRLRLRLQRFERPTLTPPPARQPRPTSYFKRTDSGACPGARGRRSTGRLQPASRAEERSGRTAGGGRSPLPRRAPSAALAHQRAGPAPMTWRWGGGAKVGGGRVGEEERGERGRQSGERKVREARSGSETREPVRHCGPEKRRARGEEERAGGRDGPLPPTPEREALFLASQRAPAAAAAGRVTRPRAAANCCECTGRGPGGGGGGGSSSSSRVAVKNVSH